MHGFRTETPRAPGHAEGGFAGWSMTAVDIVVPLVSATVWLCQARDGQSDSGSVARELGSVTSPRGSANEYSPSLNVRRVTLLCMSLTCRRLPERGRGSVGDLQRVMKVMTARPEVHGGLVASVFVEAGDFGEEPNRGVHVGADDFHVRQLREVMRV